jgi:hypothetical protein
MSLDILLNAKALVGEWKGTTTAPAAEADCAFRKIGNRDWKNGGPAPDQPLFSPGGNLAIKPALF